MDDLHAADAFLRMLVDRHSAAVVGDGEGVVVVEGDGDFVAVAGDRLVRGVVDHFLREVIRPLRGGVHSRPFTDGLETGEYFNCRGVVGGHYERRG